MELVTVLPDAFNLRLRAALPREISLSGASCVDGPGGLAEIVESRAVDLLVVDPADRRIAGHLSSLTEFLSEHDWIPCAVYTSLSCAGIKPVVDLCQHGVRGLLLAGSDDHPSAIRGLVERLTADAVADQLLLALERPLHALPTPLTRAVAAALGAPHRFPTVEDLAVKAGMTVRHVHRLVTSAGLTSPLKVLVAGRVLRAYQFFRSSEDTTLDDAAKRLRIDPRSLSNQIRATFELDSVAETRRLQPADAVTRCVRTLYRPPAAMLRAAGDSSVS